MYLQTLNLVLRRLLLAIRRPRNLGTQVKEGQFNWEVNTLQHEMQLEIPRKDAEDEYDRARRDLQLPTQGFLALGQHPIGAGEQEEGEIDEEEDNDENDVGPERADYEKEADDAHEEK